MIRRFLLALAFVLFPAVAFAQAGGNPNNAVGVWGQDTVTGLPCIIAPASGPGSATCKLPTGPGSPQTFSSVTCTQTQSTITTGGTAQNAIAAAATYKLWFFQNTSIAAITWRADGTAATAASFSIPSGVTVLWSPGTIPTNTLSIFGATTGQSYVVETCS